MSASPELPSELLGDEVRIKQILINILNNSIKYTEKGQVKFTAQFEVREGISHVIYTVEDTGIGIKKESIGLTKRELDFIREEVEKRMSFDRIYFQAGSPGIAVNVGPGTFGLIYLRK